MFHCFSHIQGTWNIIYCPGQRWKDGKMVSRFCFQWQNDTRPSPFLQYHLGYRFMLLEGSYLFPSLLFLPHRALFSCLTQSHCSTGLSMLLQFSTDSTSLSVSQPQGYNREQKGSRCISWYKWMIQRMYISAGAWSSHLKHNVFKTKEQPGNIEWHMIKFNVYFPFSSGLVSKPWGKYLAGFLAAECSSVFSYRHFVCLRLLLGRYYSAGL